MTFKEFFLRFRDVERIYVSPNISLLRHSFYLIDWFFSYLIHGASISDYFAYGFYKMKNNGRREYVTYGRHKRIQKICNNEKYINIFRNKILFNNYFSGMIGREWLDVDIIDEYHFRKFFEQHSFVFVKDINGYCGKGVFKYESLKCDIPVLYRSFKYDKHSHFILEEPISQVLELSDFHPWSINTIRIVTLFDDINDKVHIMAARFRIGNEYNSIDNFHAHGLCANIDVDTGIINSSGYDKLGHKYVLHPITQKQIVGFKIPYWNECKDFVSLIARIIPEVRYVGWDIVIQDNGQFSLIEGNDNADHDIQQMFAPGLWKQYKSIIKYF